jgi:hypothetical protein
MQISYGTGDKKIILDWDKRVRQTYL